MDVEKTIEFLLNQQAQFDARFDARFEAQQARSAEEIRQSRLEFDERLKRHEETHNREMGQIRAELRRGVRMAVEEARRERARRRELAAAQALTEEKLQQLIDSLRQPRNGHDKS